MQRPRPRTYTHPDNFDITKRPSNASLRFVMFFAFLLSALPGALLLPLIYSWIIPSPDDDLAKVLAAVGGLIGLAVYFPLNLQSGRRKKREFISAGGDPTGISDHMFGAMGGRKFSDGGWEWSSPDSSAD